MLITLPFLVGGLLWLKDNHLDGIILPAMILYMVYILMAPLRRAWNMTGFRVYGPVATSFTQSPKTAP